MVNARDGGHVPAEHTKEQPCTKPYGCMICQLFICSICGLSEGALTTECPGDLRSERGRYWEISDAVYKGSLDYKNGEWVEECSPFSPVYVRDVNSCTKE